MARMNTPESCESVRLAGQMGVDVDWYRWMFAVCDCTDCDPGGRMFGNVAVSA